MANSYTTRVFPQPDIRSPHAQPAGSNSSFSTSLASSPALSVSTQSQSTFLAYDNSGFDINTLVDAALSQAKLDPEVVVAAAQLCRLANGRWESSSPLYFGGGGGGGGMNGMTGVNNFNGISGVNNNNVINNFGGLSSGASGTIERNSKPNSKSPSVMALSNLLLPDETEFASQSVYDYA
ncbi:5133_t:CDS:2 [Paraglomus brasilianum]|uniref:5133_t:CDS:1 n=1 Tax=Paraglomus brasilianum TaxID=144538 RepID=A0A9N8YWR1_9GLOM|nr:5133_t:CDS:2 [Paraglomus brasilianum]